MEKQNRYAASLALATFAALAFVAHANPGNDIAAAAAPTGAAMAVYGEIWNDFYGPGRFAGMLKADCIAISEGTAAETDPSNAIPSTATIRLAIDGDRYAEWKSRAQALLAESGLDAAAVDIEEPGAILVAGTAYAFPDSDMREIEGFRGQEASRISEMFVKVSAIAATGGVARTWSLPLEAFRRTGNDSFRLPFRGLNRLGDVPTEVWDWKQRGAGTMGQTEYATADLRLAGIAAEDGDIAELRCEIEDSGRVGLDDHKTPIEWLFEDMVEVPDAGFSLCGHETPQSLWVAVMGDNPSYRKDPEYPVEMVSIADIDAFLEKLNGQQEVVERGVKFRLPTEAEWAMACRAGGTNEFGLVEEDLPGEPDYVAWHKGNSGGMSHAIGKKMPNRWGFFDMHGNVREWTSSRKGFFHIIRGGGWADPAWECFASRQIRFIPEIRNYDLGFRLAY